MKNEIISLTPEAAGLTLAVKNGPIGEVRDNDWPCIAYPVQLSDSRRRVIWTGDYRLGVGHVKWPTLAQVNSYFFSARVGLTIHEENICRIHSRGQTVKKTPESTMTEAVTAAKLAKAQKVAPKLNDVCHSLLSDGSAFFDGYKFEDWASEYGYSDDSIKAKETFDICDRIGRDLSRVLSRDELAGLREWANQY